MGFINGAAFKCNEFWDKKFSFVDDLNNREKT
jgi:hypothetical protein